MLTDRQKQILHYLSADEYVTSSFLSTKLDISNRTVRSEMSVLEKTLPSYGMHLVSKPRFGYSVEITDKQLMEKSIQTLDDQQVEYTPKQRVSFILEYLLAHQDYVKISNLCDLLYISQSTISQDLKTIRSYLADYNLTLENKPHHGMKIVGSELDVRQCISKSFNANKDEDDFWLANKKQMQIISDKLEEILKANDFAMSDFAFNNLTLHIVIAINRITHGQYVPISKDKLTDLQARPTYSLASQIVKAIEKTFNVKFPESECGYIEMHLLGKQLLKEENLENIIISEEIYKTVDEMLKVTDNELNLNLSDDFNLRISLVLHMVPFEHRLKYGFVLRNPLLAEIKQRYMLAFLAASAACVVLSEKYNTTISEDEIGYIAIHMNLAIEKNYSDVTKKNIVMVCSTGRGTAELLEYQYRTRFGAYIDRLVTCEVNALDSFDFTNYDLIISTVDITKKVPVPVLRVQVFLEEHDAVELKKLLVTDSTNSIESFFDRSLFITHSKAKTRDEIVDEMIALIKKKHDIPKNFKELVMLRERKAQTAFGNMVALPHPFRTCTEDTFICIAILDEPIKWGKETIQMVFMMSIEKDKKVNLQRLYKIISRFLTSKEYVKTMISSQDYDTLMKIFHIIEENTFHNFNE